MKFSKPTVSYLHAVKQGFSSFPEPEEPSPRVFPSFLTDFRTSVAEAAAQRELQLATWNETLSLSAKRVRVNTGCGY
jgi:hypothetical protein